MSVPSTGAEPAIYERPAELLQQLIRFDTTNPPGDEADCIAYIDGLLTRAGIQTTIHARDPRRPNLVARVPGRGDAPPLLLHGHVDVVTTAHQSWQHPPFAADSADGYIWGRGALDMKGGVAMILAAVLRAHAERAALPGDVVVAIVGDEEAGGDFGAGYLATQHADLFKGIRYALGEGGGFAQHFGGKRFYPIMVAEKQPCWMQVVVRGPGGHGSRPLRGGAMARLGHLLRQLDQHRLPVHITPVMREMIGAMTTALPAGQSETLRRLLDPDHADQTLDALGTQGQNLDPLLHNTISATTVHGGEKINVIPSEITIGLDGRLLPGYTLDDMRAELRQLVGDALELEVVRHDPGPDRQDMGLFDTLAGILREVDPKSVPVPSLLAGFTDGRHFARLGIQTYGFLPLNLPAEPNLYVTVHGADERVPADALDFGANAVYQTLRRFGAATGA